LSPTKTCGFSVLSPHAPLAKCSGKSFLVAPEASRLMRLMDSQTLRALGFSEWHRFASGVESLAPESKGVYAFRSSALAELRKGASDIMYIGRAMSDLRGPYHNIRHALREYLHPGRGQRTKLRVGHRAEEQEWEVSWMFAEHPDGAECELLRRFYREHNQLPQENRNWPPGCLP